MARFLKGKSGNPTGRPKGTFKIRIKVKEILDGLGFKPFEEAVALYRSTKKEMIKKDLIIDLCNYVAPKLRAIELTNQNENPFVVTLNLAPKGKDQEKILNLASTIMDEEDEEVDI